MEGGAADNDEATPAPTMRNSRSTSSLTLALSGAGGGLSASPPSTTTAAAAAAAAPPDAARRPAPTPAARSLLVETFLSIGSLGAGSVLGSSPGGFVGGSHGVGHLMHGGAPLPAVGSFRGPRLLSPRRTDTGSTSAVLLEDAAPSLRSSPGGASRWWAPASRPASGAQEPEVPELEAPLLGADLRPAQALPPGAAAVGGGRGGARATATGADAGGAHVGRALVFGAINAVAGIPALIAFANVVFRDAVYAPYLDRIAKLFFLSSAVHQAVFCALSSLPYAIGQVQDVGLIVLSAMASSVASLCAAAGRDAATAVGTSLLAMTLATAAVGGATYAVARFRLGEAVQHVPLPVIGGYLGYVGYFCVASGVGLGTSLDLGGLRSWAALAAAAPLAKLAPTLAATAAMMAALARSRHPAALPLVMAAIVLAFHAARLAAGASLADAAGAGWVLRPTGGRVYLWDLYALFNVRGLSLDGVFLPALARQGAKVAALALVVVFGSAMDVAAIQADVPAPIDFDRELTVVAASNGLTGLLGCGFTGSYIFSQTIFTMRAGVASRWCGALVAAAELALAALPFSVVQYLPNFFFGSLLCWFGAEIARDWLLLSWHRLTSVEYALLWATFFAVLNWGLEAGIAAGFMCSALYFAAAYARSHVESLERLPPGRGSGVVRSVEQAAVLARLRPRCVAAASLAGFCFFGSANSIGHRLRAIAAALAPPDDVGAGGDADELAELPRFLVIDMGAATGLDATGARTLSQVCRGLLSAGVVPVWTRLRRCPGARPLLLAHGVPLAPLRWPPEAGAAVAAAAALDDAVPEATKVGDGGALVAQCPEFASLEEGLRFAEDALLRAAAVRGLCRAADEALPLAALLRRHLAALPLLQPGAADAAAAALAPFLEARAARRGDALWAPGDAASTFYFIEQGAVAVDEAVADPVDAGGGGQGAVRSYELGVGCVVGATDWALQRPRASRAVVASPAARLVGLSRRRGALQEAAVAAPAALAALLTALLRANSADLVAAAAAAAPGR